ncbi:uncharacterized protein LOC132641693 isoform X3 [Lycium barbarum]|uniref:uncharacterized protein LOC132641693 isoform X3 n=1 Tax=Lycium barbarum TaxID=112863 RepID=UPI00293F1B93|nr:uncharacterized protein LOC132641693 isoform X3 [Lycium barbarum]
MMGSGLQFNRSFNGEDRFYSAAKAHRNVNRSFNGADVSVKSDVAVNPKMKADESPEDLPVAGKLSPAAAAEGVLGICNLERFLKSVTPSVPAQFLSKTTMRGWKTCDAEFQPYYVLGDLWESFKEWSAYGAGVPLVLTEGDSVVQYYVPYLSGIQLYGDPTKASVKTSRRPGEESDSDYFRDSSSDGSSDSEHERRCLNYTREQWLYHSQTSESSLSVDGLSLRDRNATFQEGFSSDESESGSSQGALLFEYLAHDHPYGREPLADKISDLAQRFPELKMMRSCDLLPSSWISVAWYPIYRIPTGPTLKALDACFLTFHFLHTPTTGSPCAHAAVVTCPSDSDGAPKIPLPAFGLASYKFKASLWTPNGGPGRQLMSFLLQAADNWLTQLQVNHPDFSFFCQSLKINQSYIQKIRCLLAFTL